MPPLKSLLLPLLPLLLLLQTPKVPKLPRKHLVTTFSDRGLSPSTLRLLRLHGFITRIHTKPNRPPFLSAKWEKVFALRSALTIARRNNYTTVTWMDDDLLPDMSWLRRVISHKDSRPVLAAYEVGLGITQIMSNLLTFRVDDRSDKLLEEWTARHVDFFNRSGLQDQRALNAILKCNDDRIVCVSHSFHTRHTFGSSSLRLQILNRAAEYELWKEQHGIYRVFLLAWFIVLLLRVLPWKIAQKGFEATRAAFLLLLHNPVISTIAFFAMLTSIHGIPDLSWIGTERHCSNIPKVRRLHASSLAISAHWVYTRGALVHVDWMNRQEIICVGSYSGTKVALLVWLMERKVHLFMMLHGAVAALAGGFVALIIQDRELAPALVFGPDTRGVRKAAV